VKSVENVCTFTGFENQALPARLLPEFVSRSRVPSNVALPFNATPVTGLIGTGEGEGGGGGVVATGVPGIAAATSFECALSIPLAFTEVTT
jgi:hypothetical protein